MIMFNKSLALAALCLCSLTARADIVNIDNAELSRLAAEGVPIIDIRTEAEWKSTGVIAGSKLITFFDASGNANPQWLEQAKSVARADQPVILICRSGNRTKAATRFLGEQAGYTKVYNVSHGLNGWISAGRPLTPLTPATAK
jgi:rhodanese-related sulfurtransferase